MELRRGTATLLGWLSPVPQDIKKMADLGKLGGLTITMKKQPQSLKVLGEVKERNDEVLRTKPEGEVVLYEGPVRRICPLAPNNVNTMAAGALAAHTLGFDGVRHAPGLGCAGQSSRLPRAHVVCSRGRPCGPGRTLPSACAGSRFCTIAWLP